MKCLVLFFLLPVFFFGQEKDDWTIFMKTAMNDIQAKDYKTAIINLDKSLEVYPKNPSALYFKGYLQIIEGENEAGCKSLADAIYYNSNNAKTLFPEKCMEYNPKLNPENFKTGKFTLRILDDSMVYNFERKNDVQIETFEGKEYYGAVQWMGDGDYTIIPTGKTKEEMKGNPQFIIRMLKIEDNSYLYEKIEDAQIQYGIITKVE